MKQHFNELMFTYRSKFCHSLEICFKKIYFFICLPKVSDLFSEFKPDFGFYKLLTKIYSFLIGKIKVLLTEKRSRENTSSVSLTQ